MDLLQGHQTAIDDMADVGLLALLADLQRSTQLGGRVGEGLQDGALDQLHALRADLETLDAVEPVPRGLVGQAGLDQGRGGQKDVLVAHRGRGRGHAQDRVASHQLRHLCNPYAREKKDVAVYYHGVERMKLSS